MAKTNAELQTLEEAQSRNEQFLDYLCGRATDLNALPKPESRVEELLEFLCYNGGIGGGGGANPFTGLTNATLNGDIITFDKSDGTTLEVRLTDFIRGELTKVGGDARYEDKIPQLNANGKVDISMIPDLSFNKIHSANNEIEANELINNSTAQIGDTIIVKDTGSVYLYVNDQAVDFNDRTIEIAFANGAVKMVNGQIPNPQGNVTVNAEHINYDNTTSQLQSDNVKEAIDEINGKFVSNVRYDEPTRTLKQIKNNQELDVVTGIVTKWGDLEHTLYAEKQNLFDKDTQTVEDTRYTVVSGGGGRIETDPTCRITKISCKAGYEFTVVKGATHDSQQVGIFNSQNQHIYHLNVPKRVVNGKQTYLITIPTNLIDVAYVAVNMYKAQVSPDEVMVFEGNLADNEIPKKYCPFTNGYTAIIDSKKVAMSFDPTGSNLASLTTHDAIIELDKKIVNTGGGTVTSVNGVMPNGGDVELTAVISHPNKNILL